jgi:FlaA1/EpsC-like NDP-sugar epimerase
MELLLGRLRPRRTLILAGFDGAVWLVATVLFASLSQVYLMRQNLSALEWSTVGLLGVGAAVLHLLVGRVVQLHNGRAALGTQDEMMLLGLVVGAAGAITVPVSLIATPNVPVSVPIAATFAALVAMAGGRAVARWAREPVTSPRALMGRNPVVVIGAGDAGRQLIGSMLRDKDSAWCPVALLDDDLMKRHLRVRGVPVVGTSEHLAQVAERSGARTAIVAIPSASAERIRALTEQSIKAGVALKVLPATKELLSPHVDISDVRDINVTDLLGRHQVETDLASMAEYLTGKRVLVTGAGGSIGSELCRQVARFGPSELIMLDRDESALHSVQLSIYGKALLDSDDVVLGDIRDTEFVNALFETRRPQVVFHAAALKHLPMLEQYPGEAVKTNVWGTLTILEAARQSGVQKFVNISTDKAANPVCVLGYSKRLAEALTAAIAPSASGTYLSVRFGNVLGSRGSVLTAFAAQIAAGGPLTVTHPDMTRYFMTVQEAVQLVIQAAAIGSDGEALVLDMGKQVSIDHVARQLIELSRKPIDIVYTGLREGEKLHEDLLGDGELDLRPIHPLVSHTPVPPLDPLTARGIDPWSERRVLAKTLNGLCHDLSSAKSQVTP